MSAGKPGSKITYGRSRNSTDPNRLKKGNSTRRNELGKTYEEVKVGEPKADLENLIPSKAEVPVENSVEFKAGQIWRTRSYHPTIANFFTVPVLKKDLDKAEHVVIINDYNTFSVFFGSEEFTFVRVAPIVSSKNFRDELGDVYFSDEETERLFGEEVMVMLSYSAWVLSGSLEKEIGQIEFDGETLTMIENATNYQQEMADTVLGGSFMHVAGSNDDLKFHVDYYGSMEYLRRPANLVNLAMFWQHYKLQAALNMRLTRLTISVNSEGEYILSCSQGAGKWKETPLDLLLSHSLSHQKRELKNLMAIEV